MSAHLIKSADINGNLEANLSVCSEMSELINEMTGEKKGSQGKVRELSTLFVEELGWSCDLLTPQSRKKDTPACYFVVT